MSIVGIGLNLLLAALLGAALVLGWRLNQRLKGLRESHAGFAKSVRELDGAAQRAEHGLANLRVATDEALDLLGDRIEKGRALAAKLEQLIAQAPAADARRLPDEAADRAQERRLGALLAAARESRARPERLAQREIAPARAKPAFDDDLFEDAPPPRTLSAIRGGRR